VLANLHKDQLILALDVGSSSVRAMLFDRVGNALENVFAQQPYIAETTPDGGSMIEPDLLCELIFSSITQVLDQAGSDVQRIAAVVMDTLVTTLIGVDAVGQATTQIYTWADTRGGNLVEDWRARLNGVGISESDYIRITGCRVHTSYWPLRLLWLQAQTPAVVARTAFWMSLGDYIQYRLSGERKISISAASWTGLLDRQAMDWDLRVLEALSLRREQLSGISAQSFILNGSTSRWPALERVPWLPAVSDGAAANVGAGCTTPNRVALSVGTSAALRVIVSGAPESVPDGLFAYRVDTGRSLIGGALSNAGNLYAWFQRELKPSSGAVQEVSIAAMQPDSHGLTILPFFAGERAPGWNPDAQAILLGLTLNTTADQLLRAALEAVAYRFYQVALRLAPLLTPDVEFIASGSAILSSPTWLQIVADVLNAPVYATAEAESTIRGTVFLATGHEPPPRLGQGYVPDPGRHAIYQQAASRQQALYELHYGGKLEEK
jgi:gluconokinase